MLNPDFDLSWKLPSLTVSLSIRMSVYFSALGFYTYQIFLLFYIYLFVSPFSLLLHFLLHHSSFGFGISIFKTFIRTYLYLLYSFLWLFYRRHRLEYSLASILANENGLVESHGRLFTQLCFIEATWPMKRDVLSFLYWLIVCPLFRKPCYITVTFLHLCMKCKLLITCRPVSRPLVLWASLFFLHDWSPLYIDFSPFGFKFSGVI